MKLDKIIVFSLLFLLVFTGSVLAASDNFQGKDKIAFVSDKSGNDDIYLINDNGQNLTQLTDNKEDEYHPIWSPDGSKLLYLSDDGKFFNTTYKLWIMNKDGSNKKMLTDKLDYHAVSDCPPAWSPDGSKVLFVTKGEAKKNIVILNVETGNRKILTDSDTEALYPAWSPDGSKIACFLKGKRKNGLYVMNADGTNVRRLTERGGGYLEPTWSPKGDRIAFVYDQPFFSLLGRHPGLYVVNLDGKTGLRLYRTEEWRIENLDWNPGGTKLSFTHAGEMKALLGFLFPDSSEDEEREISSYDTCITEVSKNNQVKVVAGIETDHVPLSWASNGQRIAYTDNYSAYVEPTGQSEGKSKFDVPYAIGTPKWGPADNKLVCVGYGQILGKDRALYVFDYREPKVYKLTEGESIVKHPVWMPKK